MRLRQAGPLPILKPVRAGGDVAVETTLDHVEPVVPPKGAPPRYRVGRRVEVTDFASWADLAALMAPLYTTAATIPADSPLQAELTRIAGLSPDPVVRTEAALALVQNRVRYVALAMGAGGYVPATAATTWARRYGDCKGKTALLLALLHAMGIAAEPVLVSSNSGDGLDARLPLVGLFNHVLVRATIAGRTYWLDGTRSGDTSLARLATPDFGWGLPLVAHDAALVRMVPAPLAEPGQDTAIRIDASAGISAPAPARVQTILRGDEAIGISTALASVTGDARDRALKDYWKTQYDFIEVKSATASFDAKTGEEHLAMTGDAKLDWANGNYQTDGTNVGYHADFSRDPGPDRDAPFAVAFPYFTRTRETIMLPKGSGTFKPGTGMEVDQTAGGIEYKRHASVTDGVFTIEKTERSVVPEFPAKDAPAAQAALRMLADRPATVRMPAAYAYSGEDIAAVRAEVPTTSAAFVTRAKVFVDRGLTAEALADYAKAIALDLNNVYAWANRSVTRIQTGDLPGARADLAKAEAIDPGFVLTFVARGMLADSERRWPEAIAAYTRAIAQEPANSYALGRRAQAYAANNDTARAVVDAAAALKLDPSWIDLYSLRAGADLRHGDRDGAIAEMQAAIANDPKRAFAHVAAARVYFSASRRADAVREYEAAIALEPKAYIFAEMSRARMPDDFAARTADLGAALKLDAASLDALDAQAALLRDRGDVPGAIAGWSKLLAVAPDKVAVLTVRARVGVLTERARAYHRIGDDDHALADAATALKLDPKAVDLYLLRANVLRGQGKADDALREAASVEAAVPENGYAHVVAANIYSAFHRDAEALHAYDRAIAIKPEAYIYVNRSLRRPKTDVAGRRADLDAALQLQPTLPEALAAKAGLQADSGDVAEAIATYSAALARSPDAAELLAGRGVVYARAGDAERAERDFAAARTKTVEPAVFNTMCWAKATAGVALDSALVDCNAALAKSPDSAAFLDSRGLVLLRLGRLDAAIADYDRALAKSPHQTSSLFGRAVAWARKGDLARSQGDAAAAATIDPDVRANFERYGVTL